MSQAANCVIQVILLAGVFFFWGLASRRWGSGIATDGTGQAGVYNLLMSIGFASLLLLVLLISHYFLPFF